MRDISQSLLLGQRARTILAKHFLIRCVLTYGATTYTYTQTKIKRLSDTEQTFSHKAQVLLEDTDKVIHGLDLEGYKAVISYGLITKADSEWIPTAPLWVVGQDRDSYRTHLECNLELEGIFDRMGKHKAESTLTLASTDTQTVKDLLTGLADTTLTDGTNTPYSNYPAYTITFDSGYDDDGIIDTFVPADGFRVGLNDTRLAKFKELLRYTEAVARIGNDGEIHIFTPVTSGTTYSNQFHLTQGRDYHNFFNKRFRRRIVSPNFITFMNHPSHDDTYTGNAKDASADLTDMLERETHYARVTSNAQCNSLAEALLSKYQMAAEKGAAVLPFLHFGQEIYDYVNVVDSRVGDERAGNVGYLTKFYEPGQCNMHFGFGRVPVGVATLQGLAIETGAGTSGAGTSGTGTTGFTAANLLPLIENAYDYINQIIDILGYKVDTEDVAQAFESLWESAYFRKATVTEELNIPSEAA